MRHKALVVALLGIFVLAVAMLLLDSGPRVLEAQTSIEFRGHDPEPLVLSVTPEGRMYVLQKLNESLQVQAFGPDGQRLWIAPVKGSMIHDWGAVVFSPGGAKPKYVRLPDFETRPDTLLVRVGENGEITYRPVPIDTAGLEPYPSVVPTNDFIYIGGGTVKQYSSFATGIKADYAGVRHWKTVETSVDGMVGPAAVDDEGNLVLTGDIYAGVGPLVVKYSAAGKRMWKRETEVLDGTRAIWVGADQDGRIATIFAQHEGNMTSSGDDMSRRGQDFVLSIYSPTGRLLRTTVLSHGAGLWIRDAAINGKGEIIIVGNRRRTTLMGYPREYDDAQVIKCDANGDIVWSHRVKTPPGCLARQVEVDKRGDIYVSGSVEDISFIQSLSSSPKSQREIYVSRFGVERSDVKWFVYRFVDPE